MCPGSAPHDGGKDLLFVDVYMLTSVVGGVDDEHESYGGYSILIKALYR
jgi:hypothetical protein